MTKHRWVSGIIVSLAVGFLVGSARAAEPQKFSKKVTKAIGADAAKIIAGGTRVAVFRLETAPATAAKPAAEGSADDTILGYKVKSKGPRKGKLTAERLNKVLLSRFTYSDLETIGKFQPAVAYRIKKGKDAVVVLLSFDTNEMKVVAGEEKPKEETIPITMESRGILVRLTKELLPRDAELQRLKD